MYKNFKSAETRNVVIFKTANVYMRCLSTFVTAWITNSATNSSATIDAKSQASMVCSMTIHLTLCFYRNLDHVYIIIMVAWTFGCIVTNIPCALVFNIEIMVHHLVWCYIMPLDTRFRNFLFTLTSSQTTAVTFLFC